MSTKYTTSHQFNRKPAGYENWSNEAIQARKRELEAWLLKKFPMPPTETDEDAHIDRVLQQHKHLFTSATPTAAAPTEDDTSAMNENAGNELLQEVSKFIARYLQCSEHQRTLLALWVLHTYCFCAARVTPYLAIRSADKQSGKTLCLQLLSLLCDHPALTSGGFTARDLALPTKEKPIAALLFDECQLTVGTRTRPKSPALRAVLAGSFHLGLGHRNIAEERNAFLPKAFASVAALPEELADRCIPIILEPLDTRVAQLGKPKQKNKSGPQPPSAASLAPNPFENPRERERAPSILSTPSTPSTPSTETPERLDLHHIADQIKPLRDRLERWTKNHFNLLTKRALLPRSAFPPNLSPRQQDLCDPLLQIAALVGGPWIARALEACAIVFDVQSIFELRPNLQLLADVRDCFAHHNWPDRLPTELLQDWTDSLPPRPWDADGPLNARQIAHLLRPFHIHPRELRMEGNRFRRGYELKDFQDAWEKFLRTPGSLIADLRNLVKPAARSQPPAAQASQIPNKDAPCDTIGHDAGAGPRASESRTTRTEERPLGRIRKVNACHPERSASKTPHPTTFLSAESKDPENVGSDDVDSGSSPQYVASKNAVHRRTSRTSKKKLASVIPHHRPPLHETSVQIPMEKEVVVSPARKDDLANLVKLGASSQPLAAQPKNKRPKVAMADRTASTPTHGARTHAGEVVIPLPSAPAQQPRPDEILPGITCGDVFDDRWLRAFRR